MSKPLLEVAYCSWCGIAMLHNNVWVLNPTPNTHTNIFKYDNGSRIINNEEFICYTCFYLPAVNVHYTDDVEYRLEMVEKRILNENIKSKRIQR